MHRIRPFSVLLLLGVSMAIVPVALAHVKWFSSFSFLDPPLTIREILTPTYMGVALLSMAVIAVMVLADRRLDRLPLYKQVHTWLSGNAGYSVLVMRIAMAAVLLISWAADAVLTPELLSDQKWLTWLQFIGALLLLTPRSTPMGGITLLLIYVASVVEFGLFHMLDYLHYVGIGVYLAVSQSGEDRLRELGLPALYATIGFSLIWLGYEKLFYPSWALYLLEQNPQLTLGFSPAFFLQCAAFVELCLGYLLLIGLLERPLAATITVVFFMTTMVFGKLEVIGHTPLHAALIVFLFNGPGAVYKPPMAIHQKLGWRVAFASFNFLLVLAIFAFAYSFSAQRQYQSALANAEAGSHGIGVIDLTGEPLIPEVTTIEVYTEAPDSYNLFVDIENWEFTPELAGQAGVANEGHGHVFVDGKKVGRMYSNWFHLGDLAPGKHRIVVTLNSNDHKDLVNADKLIGAEIEFTAE